MKEGKGGKGGGKGGKEEAPSAWRGKLRERFHKGKYNNPLFYGGMLGRGRK